MIQKELEELLREDINSALRSNGLNIPELTNFILDMFINDEIMHTADSSAEKLHLIATALEWAAT